MYMWMHRAVCIGPARVTCVHQEAHGITPSWFHCISWAPLYFWMHLFYPLAVDNTVLVLAVLPHPSRVSGRKRVFLSLSGYFTASVLLVIILSPFISKASACSLSSGYFPGTHGVALQQIHATPLTLHLLFFWCLQPCISIHTNISISVKNLYVRQVLTMWDPGTAKASWKLLTFHGPGKGTATSATNCTAFGSPYRNAEVKSFCILWQILDRSPSNRFSCVYVTIQAPLALFPTSLIPDCASSHLSQSLLFHSAAPSPSSWENYHF